MIGEYNDDTSFPYRLLLIDRQVSQLRNNNESIFKDEA